jgi:hypothetical protein
LATVAEEDYFLDLASAEPAPVMKWFRLGDSHDKYAQLDHRRTHGHSTKRVVGTRWSHNGKPKTQRSRSNNETLASNAVASISATAPKPQDSVTRLLQELSESLERKELEQNAKAQPCVLEAKNVDYICLRYSEENLGKGQQAMPNELTARVGEISCFSAHVDIMSEKHGPLEEHFKFIVEPPLPEGLELHDSNGLISGIARKAQDAPSIHRVAIIVDATGKGGVPLGMVPLVSCTIIVHIVD